VRLPKSAKVVIVPEDERAKRALEKLGSDRLRRYNIKALQEGPVARTSTRSGSRRPKPRDIDDSAYEPDARARAILRGKHVVEEDLKQSGGAFELDQVQKLLNGISRQMVDRKVRDRSLLAVNGPSNRRVYPTVQFNRDGSLVSGLKRVREALPTENPWVVLNFLVHPDVRLGGRKPIELLREGEVDLVVQAASAMGNQGA
jgi:hypothetical protein